MANGRDSKGRFKKGEYQGGPGRRPREAEAEYLSATIETVSLARWRRIVQAAAEAAEQGDAKARRWLSDYLLGKPAQRLEIDMNADELALYSQAVEAMRAAGREPMHIFERLIARAEQDLLEQQMAAQKRQGAEHGDE